MALIIRDLVKVLSDHTASGFGGIGRASREFLAPGLFLVLLVINSPAQTQRICAVCTNAITGKVFVFNDRAHGDRKILCEPCTLLTNRCDACLIPVLEGARKLDDGRFLCATDAGAAIFTQEEAQRAFDDVRRDLHRMFSGYEPIPYRNLEMQLVDKITFARTNSEPEADHTRWITMGLTRTVVRPDQSQHHFILLRNGMLRSRLMAVAAHEFAHAWLHENMRDRSKIHGDTVEAFCELVAYKLMSEHNQEFEKYIIHGNLYTKGQIKTLIRAENELQFYRLLDWMKTGADDRIEQDDVTQTIRLRTREIPPPIYYPAPLATSTDYLVLKAITGGKSRRFALINNTTFAVNESAKVRLGSTNVVIRCVDILDTSVIVRIEGSADAQELTLGQN